MSFYFPLFELTLLKQRVIYPSRRKLNQHCMFKSIKLLLK